MSNLEVEIHLDSAAVKRFLDVSAMPTHCNGLSASCMQNPTNTTSRMKAKEHTKYRRPGTSDNPLEPTVCFTLCGVEEWPASEIQETNGRELCCVAPHCVVL